MKEQLLSDGDRAALQSLIPLASALGISTAFALFFGPRKRASYALFEIFAIVAVLIAAALTAATAISLLHRERAISDKELLQTAMPLVVAAFLLVFVTVLARLRAAGDSSLGMLPFGLVCAYVAAMLTLSVWAATPEDAGLVAFVILAVGGVLSYGTAFWERQSARRVRRGQVDALTKTIRQGYEPARQPLQLLLPEPTGAAATEVACWVKKDRVFLDLEGCRRLGKLVEERWDALREGATQQPIGGKILAGVDVRYRVPLRRDRPEVRIATVVVPGGNNDVQAAPMNEDGLIDVTDLGLL